MTQRDPGVSIGMPVYNGQEHVAEAIESILNQTFSGFELIISDNGSTDATQQICERYAAGDKRIRHYCSKENRGAAWNFNRVFQLAQGEYFKWAAHDDVLAPDYLQKCVTVLDQDPSIILCHSKTMLIDENSKSFRNYPVTLSNTASEDPQDRFGDLIMLRHSCIDIFGLIRSDALRQSSLIGGYVGSDRVLLVELGLAGRFYEVPEYLFFSRDHSERSVRAIPTRLRAGWFDTSRSGRFSLPHWRQFLGYYRALRHSSIDGYERRRCYGKLKWWVQSYWRRLVEDVTFAARL